MTIMRNNINRAQPSWFIQNMKLKWTICKENRLNVKERIKSKPKNVPDAIVIISFTFKYTHCARIDWANANIKMKQHKMKYFFNFFKYSLRFILACYLRKPCLDASIFISTFYFLCCVLFFCTVIALVQIAKQRECERTKKKKKITNGKKSLSF